MHTPGMAATKSLSKSTGSRRATAAGSSFQPMNVNETEYMAVLDDIMDALEKNGVGQREQEELLMISYSLRKEILRL